MDLRDALLTRHLPTEDHTARLAASLALRARPGDVLALEGDLGMGKSVFARGFIRALCGADTEVPSPTFTLVQTYDSDRGEIFHFDLYRLEDPDEALELGLEDAFADGISLIEWPDRLGPLLPAHALRVIFLPADPGRYATLAGTGDRARRLAGV